LILQYRYNESVKETLEAINQMQADGVIGKYAIGGAVGALLYLEPASTVDIDIFVVLPTPPGTTCELAALRLKTSTLKSATGRSSFCL
jgi:hypothetical protein